MSPTEEKLLIDFFHEVLPIRLKVTKAAPYVASSEVVGFNVTDLITTIRLGEIWVDENQATVVLLTGCAVAHRRYFDLSDPEVGSKLREFLAGSWDSVPPQRL